MDAIQRREARRKRILENADSRLESLKSNLHSRGTLLNHEVNEDQDAYQNTMDGALLGRTDSERPNKENPPSMIEEDINRVKEQTEVYERVCHGTIEEPRQTLFIDGSKSPTTKVDPLEGAATIESTDGIEATIHTTDSEQGKRYLWERTLKRNILMISVPIVVHILNIFMGSRRHPSYILYFVLLEILYLFFTQEGLINSQTTGFISLALKLSGIPAEKVNLIISWFFLAQSILQDLSLFLFSSILVTTSLPFD